MNIKTFAFILLQSFKSKLNNYLEYQVLIILIVYRQMIYDLICHHMHIVFLYKTNSTV